MNHARPAGRTGHHNNSGEDPFIFEHFLRVMRKLLQMVAVFIGVVPFPFLFVVSTDTAGRGFFRWGAAAGCERALALLRRPCFARRHSGRCRIYAGCRWWCVNKSSI